MFCFHLVTAVESRRHSSEKKSLLCRLGGCYWWQKHAVSKIPKSQKCLILFITFFFFEIIKNSQMVTGINLNVITWLQRL